MARNITTRAVVVLVAVFLLFMPIGVYADGTTSIALSGSSTTVGNKVTVTISGTDSSKLSLRYNNNVFKLVNCSVSGYTTDANVVSFSGKSGQVTFEAVEPGSGDLVVSSDVLSGSSASVTVSPAASEAPAEPEASEEPKESTDTKAAESEKPKEEKSDKSKKDKSKKKSNAAEGDGDYVVDGVTYVLSERFTDREIPKGYSRTQLKIHGGTYRELTNGDLTLVYLKPADKIEGSGEFYIYDAESDSVYPYTLLGSSDYYVIVSDPDESETESFIETSLTADDEDYTAYRIGDEEGDFYYIYGTDSKGNTGWFSYDSATGSVQRFNESLLNSSPQADEEADDTVSSKKKKKSKDVSGEIKEMLESMKTSRNLIALGVFVLVVVFILLLDVLLFRRKRYDDDDDDYYDDDEDEYEDERNQDGPEVLTADNLLEAEDFEEANKPRKTRKKPGRDKQSDIWDTSEHRFADTSDLPIANDRSGKLKKQVFRGRTSESSGDGDEGKIDLIDLNDL